jgi:uncharacterized protein YegP (UPF0339 family)
MAAKFELKKTHNGQFYFHLKTGDGEIILSSEMFATKGDVEDEIESAKTNAPKNNRYERKTSIDGDSYFVLKAADGKVIGTSEMYVSPQLMEEGIESVKRSAPRAQIQDMAELTKQKGA